MRIDTHEVWHFHEVHLLLVSNAVDAGAARCSSWSFLATPWLVLDSALRLRPYPFAPCHLPSPAPRHLAAAERSSPPSSCSSSCWSSWSPTAAASTGPLRRAVPRMSSSSFSSTSSPSSATPSSFDPIALVTSPALPSSCSRLLWSGDRPALAPTAAADAMFKDVELDEQSWRAASSSTCRVLDIHPEESPASGQCELQQRHVLSRSLWPALPVTPMVRKGKSRWPCDHVFHMTLGSRGDKVLRVRFTFEASPHATATWF
ncbi:hypothetical protein KC357_g129 [Hortaea werneckii]|nr:hypothetical protein KC357_g129 [Hortaea werneckii]